MSRSLATPRTLNVVPGREAVLRTVGMLGTSYVPVTVWTVRTQEAYVVERGTLSGRMVPMADVITHTDYPHTAGSLFDCVACEITCHCSDATCVACHTEIDYR